MPTVQSAVEHYVYKRWEMRMLFQKPLCIFMVEWIFSLHIENSLAFIKNLIESICFLHSSHRRQGITGRNNLRIFIQLFINQWLHKITEVSDIHCRIVYDNSNSTSKSYCPIVHGYKIKVADATWIFTLT